ncbi:MAG: radical SAM protein [Coriobacteriaceae bacterium]|nr:radical SAM protein [Coriobacteriaceae bacterium]
MPLKHITKDAACMLCPRLCQAKRGLGEQGICGADDTLRVARAMLHFWEEPPISGTRGSGTVFFSNCSLKCSYCQNVALSQGKAGKTVSIERLTEIFLELQSQGAHNINLVTPTHYAREIVAALDQAKRASSPLKIPVVYNTSGYELPRTLQNLESYVDIYLTDFKYASPEIAAAYSDAPDYPEVALEALKEMVRQKGEYRLGKDGLLQEGVIVRHLVLPGHVAESKLVLGRVFDAVGNQVCYSLMNQYTPMPSSPPELQKKLSEQEYAEVIDFALDLGITNSFMQEGGSAAESFIPPFDLSGV